MEKIKGDKRKIKENISGSHSHFGPTGQPLLSQHLSPYNQPRSLGCVWVTNMRARGQALTLAHTVPWLVGPRGQLTGRTTCLLLLFRHAYVWGPLSRIVISNQRGGLLYSKTDSVTNSSESRGLRLSSARVSEGRGDAGLYKCRPPQYPHLHSAASAGERR
jgi:hypothetical protein